jgi:hypothetical protein
MAVCFKNLLAVCITDVGAAPWQQHTCQAVLAGHVMLCVCSLLMCLPLYSTNDHTSSLRSVQRQSLLHVWVTSWQCWRPLLPLAGGLHVLHCA